MKLKSTWCVNTEDYNESGRVYLELADATPAEAARGLADAQEAGRVSGSARGVRRDARQELAMLKNLVG